MTPKARKQASRLTAAYKEVEQVIEQWGEGTIAKYHSTEALANGRAALARAIATNDANAILKMPVPRVIGSNVLWNVTSA